MLEVGKRTGHPYLEHIQRGLQCAGRFNRVLLTQLCQHLVHVQTKLGQTALRDFDVDFFVLRAKQLDFVDIRHTKQLLPHRICKSPDLGLTKAIGLERVNHAKDVAKLVIEKGALNPAGQRLAHVANLFAYRVPKLAYSVGLGGVFDLKQNGGLAWLRKTANPVSIGDLLQRSFDFVGHLLGHLLRGGSGPDGAHHHDAKGEGRVFILAKLEIGQEAEHHQHHHQVAGQCGMVKRPFGEVKALGLDGLVHLGLTSPRRPAPGRVFVDKP